MNFQLQFIALFILLISVSVSSCLRKEYQTLLIHNTYHYVVPVVYDTTLKQQSISFIVPSGDYEKMIIQNISTNRIEQVIPLSAQFSTKSNLSLQSVELYLTSTDSSQQILYGTNYNLAQRNITLNVSNQNFKDILLAPRVSYQLMLLSDAVFPQIDTLQFVFQTRLIGK